MKVYVASKFENAAMVGTVMEMLEDAGHTIVGDWTKHTVAGLKNATLVDRLQQYAADDLAGIDEADALVLLPVSAERTRSGAHLVELGYALGKGKLVTVYDGRPGAPTEHPIFFFDQRVHHFETISGIIDFLTWAETAFAARPEEK